VERYDVISVHGNCASMSVLQEAGVKDADLLIAATSEDEVNLLCCTTAHALNPKLHTIARIRNPEYTEQIYRMRDIFGLSMVINPENQAAMEIERLLKYPGFLRRDTFAKGKTEIMLAYPSFEAVSIFRLAHSLHVLGVPLIPRMMTEYAHQKTGIDIHPGATVGESFFIDHGTGVVIGETCTIGKGVKLYQGVTLGAKSFEMDENGNPVKGIKRHPDIGDRVVIYAGATILGGNTHIGEDSVIGGNVWLTHSVPAGSKVYNTLSNKERS
jgi:serine O-acetyltransferase